MSISDIVDEQYRLHPADLAGHPLRVRIANVSYQGVERLYPVLHFEGMAKRLVLSPDLVRRLVNISGSPVFSRWVGMTVDLSVSGRNGGNAILISAPGSSVPAGDSGDGGSRGAMAWRLAAAGVIGILVLFLVLNQFADVMGILSAFLGY